MPNGLEQKDLGNTEHGRSWATVPSPHSLTFKWPQRVLCAGNEGCPGRKSKRINVWLRLYRFVCYYEQHKLPLWDVPSLRVWPSPQLPERGAAASVWQMTMWVLLEATLLRAEIWTQAVRLLSPSLLTCSWVPDFGFKRKKKKPQD